MTVPAKNLTDLAILPGVVSVKPVARYETHADPGGSGSLAQAADYVKASQVRRAGFDGTGVKVAILDSGIDFTHEYLGGPALRRPTPAAIRALPARPTIWPGRPLRGSLWSHPTEGQGWLRLRR